MKRTFRFGIALSFAMTAEGLLGCAGGSLSGDARSVNDFLAAQERARGAAMPSGRAPLVLDGAETRDVDDKAVPEVLGKPLDADAAVKLALLVNRDLRASMYELGVARGRLVQAGLLPNPEVELSLRSQQDPAQSLQAEVGLEYNLSALLLVPFRKEAAQAELSAERVRVAGEVLDTAYRARTAFYEVQARQAVLDLRARALAAFQAGFAAAEELNRAGNLPDVDLASQRAAVETSRIDVAEAENALLDARERLNVAIGLSGAETTWTIAGPLSPPPAEIVADAADEPRALKASLELGEIAGRMVAAAKRAGLSRVEGNMPHLSGGFHGEHDGNTWEIGGHMTVGLPIFDRGQGRVISAESELGALRERYVATSTAVRSSLRMAQNRVLSAGKRALHYKNAVLPARERALAETLLQYNAMQIGVFQLLEVQRRVTDTGVAYVETLLDYWKARASLEQILAGRHRVVALGAQSRGAGAPVGSGDTSGGH